MLPKNLEKNSLEKAKNGLVPNWIKSSVSDLLKYADSDDEIEKIANRTETEIILSATIQDEEAKKNLAKYIIEE